MTKRSIWRRDSSREVQSGRVEASFVKSELGRVQPHEGSVGYELRWQIS